MKTEQEYCDEEEGRITHDLVSSLHSLTDLYGGNDGSINIFIPMSRKSFLALSESNGWQQSASDQWGRADRMTGAMHRVFSAYKWKELTPHVTVQASYVRVVKPDESEEF